jgi:hypothetical protein
VSEFARLGVAARCGRERGSASEGLKKETRRRIPGRKHGSLEEVGNALQWEKVGIPDPG